MSPITIGETRDGTLPIPYIDAPVGTLEYDGHEVDVWSIATTIDGKVIYLNCTAADAAISATLKRLLRKSSGKAFFKPAEDMTWLGPTELSKLTDHYDTVTQVLTHRGMRLKNQCVIPDCVSIAAGLSRPMEIVPVVHVSTHMEHEEDTEETEGTEEAIEAESSDEEGAESKQDAWAFRYVLGDAAADCPPPGTLFAHLKSLVVVCHPEWEAMLWEHGKKRALILPQPALGIHAWSITRERGRWTDLVGELWMGGILSHPAPMPLLQSRTRRARRSPSAKM
jgi:hypothetical protein